MEYFGAELWNIFYITKSPQALALAGRKKERKEFDKMNISVFSIIAHMGSGL
jgi:hypothetical protein